MRVYLECLQKGYASIVASNPEPLISGCVMTMGWLGFGIGLWCAERITQEVTHIAKQLQIMGTPERARNYAPFIRSAEILSDVFKKMKWSAFGCAYGIQIAMSAFCFAKGVEDGCLSPNTGKTIISNVVLFRPREPGLTQESLFPQANPVNRTNTGTF